MSDIRSDPYTLKDPNDNDAFAVLKDDVRLLKQQLLLGTPSVPSTAGLTNSLTALQASVAGINTHRSTADYAAYSRFGASQPYAFSVTVIWDTHLAGTLSGMDTLTGNFTAPATGIYTVASTVALSSSAGAIGLVDISDSSSGVVAQSCYLSTTGIFYVSVSAVLSLAAGDSISVGAQSSAAGSAAGQRIEIVRL